MSYAICINCGATKSGAFRRCPICGFSPQGNDTAMAKSLFLSTGFIKDDGEPASKKELLAVQQAIANGENPIFNEVKIRELVDDKKSWDAEEVVPIWRVLLLILVILSVPVLLVTTAILLHFMR